MAMSDISVLRALLGEAKSLESDIGHPPAPPSKPPLPPGGVSGTYGGMDPWQQSVESRLGQIHGDIGGLRTDLGKRVDDLSRTVDSNFKWLLGSYGAGVVLILGALAGGFLYLADKIHH
jgi:hypothetical protein